MVAPVTGPFNKTITLKGPPTSLGFSPIYLTITRRWFRQHKPYNLVLNYDMSQTAIKYWNSVDKTETPPTLDWTSDSATTNACYNSCYNKFVEKVRDSSNWAENIAQHREAMDMITNRLVQILRFSRALRRFRLGDAAKALGVSKPKNLTVAGKDFGKLWLEFHFGWEPLVGDISKAADILTAGLPNFKIRSRHMMRVRADTSHDFGAILGKTERHITVRYQIESEIAISNPNLWLANRLGLINPAQLAWELVPFSFVVDWFANVGAFIGSFSDFYGLTLTRPFNTSFVTIANNEVRTLKSNGSYHSNCISEGIFISRATGIPGPTLRLRPAKAVSWIRGLTASSLLLQVLKT